MHGKSGYNLNVFAYKRDILGNNLVHDKSGYTVNRGTVTWGMTVVSTYQLPLLTMVAKISPRFRQFMAFDLINYKRQIFSLFIIHVNSSLMIGTLEFISKFKHLS